MWHTGSLLRHVRSRYLTGDRTRAPALGAQSRSHQTTREVPRWGLLISCNLCGRKLQVTAKLRAGSWKLRGIRCFRNKKDGGRELLRSHQGLKRLHQNGCCSLEKEMATQASLLAWKIPWTEEPGGLHTVHGVAKSRTGLSDFTHSLTLSARALAIQQKTVLQMVNLQLPLNKGRSNNVQQTMALSGCSQEVATCWSCFCRHP